ncbi:MAG: glutamine--tRNA ligase, partial [Burkholderiales bacterium]|nr:glutamine--tRNA ligase [Burkholderiales bacterium]
EHAVEAEMRLYDRLFTEQRPDAVRDEKGEYIDFMRFVNPESLKTVTGYVEACVKDAAPETRYQFERLGYFVTDRYEHQPGSRIVFNRTVGLKDTWQK